MDQIAETASKESRKLSSFKVRGFKREERNLPTL